MNSFFIGMKKPKPSDLFLEVVVILIMAIVAYAVGADKFALLFLPILFITNVLRKSGFSLRKNKLLAVLCIVLFSLWAFSLISFFG